MTVSPIFNKRIKAMIIARNPSPVCQVQFGLAFRVVTAKEIIMIPESNYKSPPYTISPSMPLTGNRKI